VSERESEREKEKEKEREREREKRPEYQLSKQTLRQSAWIAGTRGLTVWCEIV